MHDTTSQYTSINAINEIDEQLSVCRGLAELAPLLDGDPTYFPHAVLLLQLIHEAVVQAEIGMKNLVAALRACPGDQS